MASPSPGANGLRVAASVASMIQKASGAKVGDLICITGNVGAAYLGLQILEREKQVYLSSPEVKPDLEEQTYCIGRQLKPEARRDMIMQFDKAGVVPTAMIRCPAAFAALIRSATSEARVNHSLCIL